MSIDCVLSEASFKFEQFLLYDIEKVYKGKDKVFLLLLKLRLPVIPLLANIGIHSTSDTERRKTKSERKGVYSHIGCVRFG